MSTNTTLKSVTECNQSLLSDQLESNLYAFFTWGFLGIRGFYDVHIPTSSGIYGGNQYQLRMVTDPNYNDGQVWESARKDWVFERNIECANQPIPVSGVYVNGGFHPASGVGAYSHLLDYPNGRVIFNTVVPTNSTVTAEYSYRLYQFYTADSPWWQQFQTDSFRVDDSQFLQQGSGVWDTLSSNRIQLPAVVIEAIPNTSRVGFELGNSTVIVRQDVRFHIIAEDRPATKFVHDVITSQWQKRIQGFDRNLLFANDASPLTADGSPVPSGKMYPDLIQPTGMGGFAWRQIRLERMKSQEMPRINNLWYTLVTAGCEVDLP